MYRIFPNRHLSELQHAVQGTANQVIITPETDYTLTFSLPQNIHTDADVVFQSLTLDNTGLHLLDTDASHDLILKPGSNLTADRTLTFTTGDASRTLTLSANVTLNQSVATTSNPTFAGVTLSGLTASRLVATDASKKLASTGITSFLTGTANQVTITDNSSGGAVASTPQDIHTGASPTFAGLAINGSITVTGTVDGVDVSDLAATVPRLQGVGDLDESTISWSDATKTFTIAPVGASFTIYIDGVEYSKTSTSIVGDGTDFTLAAGLWFIYFDGSADLVASQTPWSFGPGHVKIATLYWDSSETKGVLAEERHGITMDWATHQYLHETIGCRYENGLAGSFTDTTFSIAAGAIHDEDLVLDIGEETTCRVFYHDGSAEFTFTAAQAAYYHTVSSVLQWNDGNTLADVDNNKYAAVWVFATNDTVDPIMVVIGNRQDANIADARAGNTYESLALGSYPYAEVKLLYRVLLKRSGSSVVYQEAQDYRAVGSVAATSYVATSHGTLTGLSNDDHTQYLLRTDLPGTLAGTTNEVSVTDDGDNTVTIGLPDEVTIGTLSLSNPTANTPLVRTTAGVVTTDSYKISAAEVKIVPEYGFWIVPELEVEGALEILANGIVEIIG